MDTEFVQEVQFEPRVSEEFQLKLDTLAVQRAVQAMNLVEIKGQPADYIHIFYSSLGQLKQY